MFSALSLVLERFLFFYLRVCPNGGFPPPLSGEEEDQLFRAAREGDAAAREKLIEHNLRLVAHIVKKYYAASRDTEDLISIGTIGLIKGIDTFDPGVGARFATYAGKCVQNEILMYFRSTKKLSNESSLTDAIEYDRDGNALTYLDVVSEEEDVADIVDFKTRAEAARLAVRRVLEPRERQIVVLRFGLSGTPPLTQREVAQKLSISRSYVSRLEKGALEKIRRHLSRTYVFGEE
ncbi:MAG: RNA polymerase sporulation sigma factor SigK [Clostridia bacterium]|nr:RNA polymerase sporulation sigma factor SigK [Clostridia bacterium]